METESIKQIKELRDNIREERKNIDKSTYNNSYGNENEYTGKGIYLGLDSLIIDISYLIKAHNQFVSISTFEEREQINEILKNILENISFPDELVTFIDELKIILRNYNVRDKKERWELFLEVNKELLEQCDEFNKKLEDIEGIKAKIDESNSTIEEKIKGFNSKFSELEEKIEEVESTKEEIVEKSESLETINISLEKIQNEAEENLKNISESLSEAKSSEKIINSFAQKVQERDNRIGELQQLTEENKEKLIAYETERISILKEAQQLIENAKIALNYSTASGLSESFQTQHNNAKKWRFSVGWIAGAVCFLLIAIIIGVWITLDANSTTQFIVGRIAIIPLPIVGAIFCANQYVKQKNIIEDYAYKMVLAKSIVGFSEQLKKDASDNKGEYIHYIKVALEEIHKDPLRGRISRLSKNKIQERAENMSFKEILEVAEKLVKINKGSQ